ncbi:MAG: glycosyltransferase family 4 protein [Chitinophagaceae bacterium]|nr:glycosyltransferase family 4 protein [Chitinophagaceae bacterium]
MAQREKILILSYFFPPCNLTPSERIFSWATYLHEANYYPIIVTRNWDLPITNATTDIFKPSGKEVIIKKFEHYEVHYLPYQPNWKERVFMALYGKKSYFLYWILALVYNYLSLPFLSLASNYSFYTYSRQLLKKEPQIKKMLVSVSPFTLLGIAHRLAKAFSLKWIADYRDDWSTNEMQYANNWAKRLLKSHNQHFEKKWMSNAGSFLTVSTHYKNKLSRLLNLPGHVMTNGFMPENYTEKPPLYKQFTITYVGSIYPIQPIELFLNAFKAFIDLGHTNCQVIFIGVANDPPIRKRIDQAMKGYENYVVFTPRISKQEAIRTQSSSHLLLASAYGNVKGVPGSKLYEYIALNKKVLLCPGDADVLESTLQETGQLLLGNTHHDIVQHLNENYTLFTENKFNQNSPDTRKGIEQYSRAYQTQTLIKALQDL